jgi:hypothetical protein
MTSNPRLETNPCPSRHLDGKLAELALSAWEAVPSRPVTWPDLRSRVSASDRERPPVTGVNGTLMARRIVVRPAQWPRPGPSPSSSIAAALGPWPLCQGSRSDRVRHGLDTADSAEIIEQRGGRHHQLGRSVARSCLWLAGTAVLVIGGECP